MYLIYYRHNHSPERTKIDRQKINFNELTIILNGSLNYYVDNEKYIVNSGNAIFIKSGSYRQRDEITEKCEYVSFNFTDEPNESMDLPIFLNNVLTGEIRQLIFCADKIIDKQYENCNFLISKLLSCLLELIKVYNNKKEENLLVKKIKTYIRNHITEKITLKDIGNATFFSPVYCEVVFKKETSMPIISFVTDSKIEEAKLLLLENSSSISKISENLGFEDMNYFIRVFKKKTGMTPLQYRKQFCK